MGAPNAEHGYGICRTCPVGAVRKPGCGNAAAQAKRREESAARAPRRATRPSDVGRQPAQDARAEEARDITALRREMERRDLPAGPPPSFQLSLLEVEADIQQVIARVEAARTQAREADAVETGGTDPRACTAEAGLDEAHGGHCRRPPDRIAADSLAAKTDRDLTPSDPGVLIQHRGACASRHGAVRHVWANPAGVPLGPGRGWPVPHSGIACHRHPAGTPSAWACILSVRPLPDEHLDATNHPGTRSDPPPCRVTRLRDGIRDQARGQQPCPAVAARKVMLSKPCRSAYKRKNRSAPTQPGRTDRRGRHDPENPRQ